MSKEASKAFEKFCITRHSAVVGLFTSQIYTQIYTRR